MTACERMIGYRRRDKTDAGWGLIRRPLLGHCELSLPEWGRTTVTWWTHKIKGLHRNDFIMAAKTDELYQP